MAHATARGDAQAAIAEPQRVVLLTSSYPRFPGDTVGTFKYQFKNEFTWGAKVGFDWGFSPAWAFSASVEYIDAKAKIDSVDFNDIDGGPPERVTPYNDREMNPKPIFLNVGVAYRF